MRRMVLTGTAPTTMTMTTMLVFALLAVVMNFHDATGGAVNGMFVEGAFHQRTATSITRLSPPAAHNEAWRSFAGSTKWSPSSYGVSFGVDRRKMRGCCERLRMTMTSSSSSSSSSTTEPIEQRKRAGTADIAWDRLGFEYQATKSHLRISYKEGEGWGRPELVTEPYIQMNIAATALHYGQSCFEGLKAFCHRDGTVHLFRPHENADRMRRSCRRLLMPELPEDVFVNACKEVVLDNLEYVPPYGSGGALYLRPILFGSGNRVGVQPADEYVFLVLVIPVGDYYAGGLSKPVDGLIVTDFDRAAPRGVGNVKVAGNYASDLLPNVRSKSAGYPIGLYLDAATQTYIDEFSTSNFVGINLSTNTYVTPESASALPSITNKSLMQLAEERMGMKVERRPVPVEELNDFDEVLAVGTAVVTTPVGSLTKLDTDGTTVKKKYSFGNEEIGTKTMELYNLVRAIQNGEQPAPDGWNVLVQ